MKHGKSQNRLLGALLSLASNGAVANETAMFCTKSKGAEPKGR